MTQHEEAPNTSPLPEEAEKEAREELPHHECYALIERSDDGEESVTYFSSTKARDKATLEAIWFGGPDECHKEEAESYLETLREKGILYFEGDPPLRWETMWPQRTVTAGRASVKASPSQAAPQEEEPATALQVIAELERDRDDFAAIADDRKRHIEELEADLTTLRARAEEMAGELEKIARAPSFPYTRHTWQGAVGGVGIDAGNGNIARAALEAWRKPAQPGAEGEKLGVSPPSQGRKERSVGNVPIDNDVRCPECGGWGSECMFVHEPTPSPRKEGEELGKGESE